MTGSMDGAEAELYKKSRVLAFKMRDFDAEDIDRVTVADFGERLLTIESLHQDLTIDIGNLLVESSDTIDPTKAAFWNQQIFKLQADVRSHRDRIKKRVLEVTDAMPNAVGNVETEKLDLLRRQVEAAEVANQAAQDAKDELLSETTRETEAKRITSVAKAKAKYSAVIDDIKELEEKVNDVEDWSKESELSIGRAMRNVKNWKEDLRQIASLNRELMENVLEYEIEEEEVAANYLDTVVVNLSEEVKRAIGCPS